MAEVMIQDITVGTGAEVEEGMLATVHYSVVRAPNTPVVAPLGPGEIVEILVGGKMIIDGFSRGLLGQGDPSTAGPMKVNGKRKLTVPPEHAYGAVGLGDIILPNESLIFDVDLLHVRDFPTEEVD